jgi:hypothetical protein
MKNAPAYRQTGICGVIRPAHRLAGAPINGISQTQLASACLREVPPCGAKAGTFLINLKKCFCQILRLLHMEVLYPPSQKTTGSARG